MNFIIIIYLIVQAFEFAKITQEIFFLYITVYICLQFQNKYKKTHLFLCAYFLLFCQLFNTSLATSIPDVRGAWSNEGCKISDSQEHDGFLICECNHLTNFALLMDVSNTRHDSFALSIVTWIGCIISIIGLAITIITHLYFK